MEFYSDVHWDIWEDLQDGTVRLVFSTTEGIEERGKPLPKNFVNTTWGPLEEYPPK